MWLDRFSQTTSNPTSNTPSRYRSPGPRRTSQLATPDNQRNGLGIGLRSGSNVSLDLASANVSNASLPLLQRRQTGSGLRQEQRPPSEERDPLEVLQQIIGPPSQRQSLTNGQKTEEEVIEIDFRGLSLQQYLEKDESSDDEAAVDFQKKAIDGTKYEDLHTSITDIDRTLESIETYLTNFKAELGQVSAEIETLQARSVNLNAQLDNRRKVEKLLGPAVEDVSLSPHTVRAIAEGPIDETFARSLTEIEARSLTVSNKNVENGHTKAADDVTPLLQELKLRAVERIRDYLVSQIKALRSPNINAQVIQQQSFLKYKELYPFLSRIHPQLAEEIGQAYANTMRWYYSSNFGRYQAALHKLSIYHIDQTDLLGSDPAARKQGVLSATKSAAAQYDPYSLGRRADYLKSNDDKALPSYLAEDSKLTSYLEVPFRNFNQALLDNLTAEYTVITDLFSTATYHQVSKRVATIFEPTFALGHSLTKSLVENTTDTLGILLCIRLNQQYAFETQKRKLPVMDDYINYTNILLWPRFQKAMDMHVESLKKTPTSTNRGAAAAFSLVGGANTANSVAPHTITQRFGQLLHGILTLSATADDDEPLSHSLGRLRSEYETLMGKLAKGAGDASKRNRFLLNNYSLVLTIISDTHGKLGEEQKEYFGTLVRDLKSR